MAEKSRNLSKDIQKNLRDYQKVVSEGYTHENFVNAAMIMKRMRPYLSLEEVKNLEFPWRDVYTDNCDMKQLKKTITEIKKRIQK